MEINYKMKIILHFCFQESDNDRPDFFEPEQLYMVLEFEFAGQDVESLNFRDARQTLSIVLQVAHILAVGESALEFEHRDLHCKL